MVLGKGEQLVGRGGAEGVVSSEDTLNCSGIGLETLPKFWPVLGPDKTRPKCEDSFSNFFPLLLPTQKSFRYFFLIIYFNIKDILYYLFMYFMSICALYKNSKFFSPPPSKNSFSLP